MSFLNFSFSDLKTIFEKNSFKIFHLQQIYQWIFKKNILSFDEMSDLSLELRKFLNKNFKLFSIKLKSFENSQDNQTKKYLFELEDGLLLESVLILSNERSTVCLSSQVGCPVRCSFCASGKKGLIRDLKEDEILQQLLYIINDIKKHPTNIVFMGMGEPLLNYENVEKAIVKISSEEFLNISQRRITISTSGIIEGIQKLNNSDLKVNLSLSLHAPNDEIRKKIMPKSSSYPIDKILKALNDYFIKTKREITFEYILIDGINDSIELARELYNLLKNYQCAVNLIPYNPIDGINYKKSSNNNIRAFKDFLINRNMVVTQRYTKGDDIAAACGQLALKNNS